MILYPLYHLDTRSGCLADRQTQGTCQLSKIKMVRLSVHPSGCPYQICGWAKSQVQKCTTHILAGRNTSYNGLGRVDIVVFLPFRCVFYVCSTFFCRISWPLTWEEGNFNKQFLANLCGENFPPRLEMGGGENSTTHVPRRSSITLKCNSSDVEAADSSTNSTQRGAKVQVDEWLGTWMQGGPWFKSHHIFPLAHSGPDKSVN